VKKDVTIKMLEKGAYKVEDILDTNKSIFLFGIVGLKVLISIPLLIT
jgi:hypothetical protein